MKVRSLVLVLVLFMTAQNSFALISPLQMLRQELANTVGANPCVTFPKPEPQEKLIKMITCSDEVGQALGLLINTGSFQIENASGKILEPTVVSKKSLEFLREQIALAFGENRLYVKTHKWNKNLVVEFKPTAIQFFVDNIGDPYGHASYLAQNLFAKVLKPNPVDKFHVGVTSSGVHAR